MAEPRVFDERTLRKLEQVMLWSQRARAGAMKGERRSTRRGTSIEFADYRNYARGDDLRRLDWNVYARLQRPYIKLLEDEEDLALHILIDASASMDWPQGAEDSDRHKFRHAQRLAAGLAWCAPGQQRSHTTEQRQRGGQCDLRPPARPRPQPAYVDLYRGLAAGGRSRSGRGPARTGAA